MSILRLLWTQSVVRARHKRSSHQYLKPGQRYISDAYGAPASRPFVTDGQLSALRVPPQLMGIIPANAGGFGDAQEAAMVFACNEVKPLQDRLPGGQRFGWAMR